MLLSMFVAVAALGGVLLSPGCGTLSSDGPYAGDQILYTADQTIVSSYDLLHTFVSWEYQNRAALSGQPEIKRAADHVRANAQQWIASAIALREAYAIAPTAETRKSLQNALVVLRAALAEAVRYMATAPPPPQPAQTPQLRTTPTLYVTTR
jgi:hypothetical protein